MSQVKNHTITIAAAYNQTIEEYGASLGEFSVIVKQLTGGDFQGSSVVVDIGDVSIIRRSSSAKYSSSWCLEGCVAFVFSVNNPSLFVNGYMYDDLTQIASADNNEAKAIFPEDSDHLVVTIKIASLSRYLSDNAVDCFLKMLDQCERMYINRQYKEEAKKFIYQSYLEIQNFHNNDAGTNIATSYCNLIISYLYEYLLFHKGERLRTNTSHERIFQRGMRYIEKLPEFSHEMDIDMDTLSSEIYASKRSIQYAFNKVSGLSPMQYLKVAKMHEIRKELLQATRKRSNLSEILGQYQIKNLGRFSREYFEFFGERPKGTISRPLKS